ncbi:C13 family peptidase [Chitiniphilus eburneus]|nr:C13 family peptidase [Chitiniphilus eburneus]
MTPQPSATATALLEAQLSAMPAKAEQPKVYGLSIAGYAWPEVFGNEARHASATLATRYGAEDAQVLLSNDPGDRERYPQANLDTLERALRGIGARMDPQRDVLMLYMVSHGQQDGSVLLKQPGRAGEALSPTWLKTTLGKAGIKYVMLAVSACFSGSFVNAFLYDPDALVLSASRSDRVSFGCSVRDDYTFFGKALLVDQDTRHLDWPALFLTVSDKVAAREKEIGEKIGSVPQIHFGNALQDHLLQAGLRPGK